MARSNSPCSLSRSRRCVGSLFMIVLASGGMLLAGAGSVALYVACFAAFRVLVEMAFDRSGSHLQMPFKLTVGSAREGDENVVALRPSARLDFSLAPRHTMISPQQRSFTELRSEAT